MYSRQNARQQRRRAMARWRCNIPATLFKNIPRFIIFPVARAVDGGQLFILSRRVICGPLRLSSSLSLRRKRDCHRRQRGAVHIRPISVDGPKALPGYSLRGRGVKAIPSLFSDTQVPFSSSHSYPESVVIRNAEISDLSLLGLLKLRGELPISVAFFSFFFFYRDNTYCSFDRIEMNYFARENTFSKMQSNFRYFLLNASV